MPRYVKKYNKKTYKRRSYRKKKSFGISPMPKSFATKLKYSTTLQLDPGIAGLAAVHVFAANDAFDPDVSGAGHQPRGFDQLMTMYDRYTVVGSKITINCANNDASSAQTVGISLRDTSTITGDENNYLEGKYTVHKLLGARDGMSTGTLSKTFSTRKFFTVPSPLSEDDLAGTAGLSPNKLAFFHLWAAPTAASDTTTVSVVVNLELSIVLTGYIQPAQS